MTSFALFRQPHATAVTLVEQTVGEPLEFTDASLLDGLQGFVVAPFAVTPAEPIVVIRPDHLQTFSTPDDLILTSPSPAACHPSASTRSTYAADFATFHSVLISGRFSKLVLARCACEERTDDTSPLELFVRACHRYPRLFIALVSTARTGTWLTATPELLLEATPDGCRTIALAGTMQLTADQLAGEGEQLTWSVKNIQEQRYVASFIADRLKGLTLDYCEEGPHTVRAADLVHLRSDFTFTLRDGVRLSDILTALHPTPAVCGLPQADALSFILSREHAPRRYYSGFMGPLQLGTSPSALYVSLRCMQIFPDRYLLYAGGGILRESTEEREWQETEAKLATMRSLLTS